jgi:hypothetical protein
VERKRGGGEREIKRERERERERVRESVIKLEVGVKEIELKFAGGKTTTEAYLHKNASGNRSIFLDELLYFRYFYASKLCFCILPPSFLIIIKRNLYGLECCLVSS